MDLVSLYENNLINIPHDKVSEYSIQNLFCSLSFYK